MKMKMKLYLIMSTWQLNRMQPADLEDVNKVMDRCYFSKFPPENGENFVVGEFEVELDLELVPPDEIVNRAAVALRQKAAGIRAAATVEAAKYEDQANQLLAIEHKP